MRFKSGILLGQSNISTASKRSRSLVFAVCDVAILCTTMAGSAAGDCRGVVQPECRGPRQNLPAFMLPGISTSESLQLREMRHNIMTEASLWACHRRIQETWRRLRGCSLTSYCTCGFIKGSTNGCSFQSRHWSSYYMPPFSFRCPYHGCQVKRNSRSELMGHCFVTTGLITTNMAEYE